MRDRLLSRVAAVAALSLALSGCATAVTGTPSAAQTKGSSTPGSPGSDGAEGLGDLVTLDPCSLVDKAALASFGDDVHADQGEAYERCVVIITGKELSFRIAIEFDQRITKSIREAGKARTRTQDGMDYTSATSSDPNDCHASIVFPDDNWITFGASGLLNKALGQAMCPAVDAAVKSAMEIISAGRVKHREYPANSWGKLNFCSLTTPDLIAKVPGVDTAKKLDFPGSHVCLWGVTMDEYANGPITAMVRSDLLLLTKIADVDKPFVRDVGGRPTMVRFYPSNTNSGGVVEPARCKAKTWGQVVRPFKSDGGHTVTEQNEVAELWVYANLPEDQLCALAVTISTDMWLKLLPS